MRIIILCLLLTGCYVHKKEIDKGEELCMANGGVKYLNKDLSNTNVTCNNGTFFRLE